MLAAVVLEVLLQLTVVQTLQRLDTGTFSILFNLRVVFATILGVLFLGEAIVPLQIAGGLMILAGIIIVSYKGRKTVHRGGVIWGISAAIVLSLLSFVHKGLINDIGYFNNVIPVLILSSIALWAIVIGLRRTVRLSHFCRAQTVRLMVYRAMSGHGIILSLAAGAVISVANYISSLGVIIIVILGAVLLNEREHLKQKIIATALAVLGLSFILLAQIA